MEKLKLAIIGASYLQVPLILKAKERGIETHVFAWEVGDEGERIADHFYPISITEKEEILSKCMEAGVDGICSIASDLAVTTVSFVAEKMGLVANSQHSALLSTNKYEMRKAFASHGDPSPVSIRAKEVSDVSNAGLKLPLVVKPVDRSGSRGVRLIRDEKDLPGAIKNACAVSFSGMSVVEEFIEGVEFSVEYISWQGRHDFLALTQKYTTGEPYYIETAHFEPAKVSDECLEKIKRVSEHALDSLENKNGASHIEIKINDDGDINIVEIGGRMGGDLIGSSLVQLSTGYDFVDAVIDIALGKEPKAKKGKMSNAAVRFILTEDDLSVLEKIRRADGDILVREEMFKPIGDVPADSSERYGYFLMKCDDAERILRYLPG